MRSRSSPHEARANAARAAATQPPRALVFDLVIRAKRSILSITLLLGGLLAFAPAAFAADGVGLWGRTDDKVITFASFAVMGFFVVVIVVFSLLQARLENRKDRAREELERLRRP